jgi:prophage regulatory protein
MPPIAFDRLPVVRQRLGGVGHTKVYDDIGKGLFPPPVKLGGGRVSVWPRHEVDAIAEAILAGNGDSQLRQLVSELVAARRFAGKAG